MAPVKPARRMARKSATSGPSKSKQKSTKLPAKMSKQVKTNPGSQPGKIKKKKPVYTDKQLNLPVLNSIIPANAKTVHKAGGTGKKKNKVYVDDTESMMTILALVNAEKEGQIESKIAKERQMEEIREARRKESERKEEKRVGKLEKVKKDIKDGMKTKKARVGTDQEEKPRTSANPAKSKRKSVSFA